MVTNAAALCASADALYRAAAESCRQHARYSRLVEHEVCDAEQDAACEMVTVSDSLLQRLLGEYEDGAALRESKTDQAWWHRANMLLHASREYVRHRQRCDDVGKGSSSHSAELLGKMQLEYELAASALMALRQAVESYRESRPEASLAH
ncbi:MAG: hypothetical protein M3081_19370 [Gemmatimonadota bacterium]|nr:hypothetical protein [Gemmatimonadota bacterium]